MRRRIATTVVLVVLAAAAAATFAASALQSDEEWTKGPALRSDARILFSALAPSEAPDLFDAYFGDRDIARADTLPDDIDLPRRQMYGLPTALRREWMGYPGVRHWVEAGCGPGTPRTIVYDPEYRSLTPKKEQANVVDAIKKARRMVASTGCHDFGLAPGSTLLFGFDGSDCTFDLGDSYLRDINWKRIDLVDIQSQRLLSAHCLERDGLATYRRLARRIAAHVRTENPDIEVFSQVSFRDNAPVDMLEGLNSVRDVIDGFYFSYPSNNTDIPCEYCSEDDLELLLSNVR